MTEIDSKVETVLEIVPVLVTSQGPEVQFEGSPYVNNHSGQPSALQVLAHSGALVIYAPWLPTPYVPTFDAELEKEFQAWETLSDEALANFERELD